MLSSKSRSVVKITLLASTALLVSSCAARKPANPQDPYETFNRSIFAFNMTVDKLVFKPVASIYDVMVPNTMQKGVNNFFYNIGEIPTVANDALQGQFVQSLADAWRFVINSTLGLGGVVDMASRMGLKRNHQDFGMTLAKWGAKESSYLVLPLLGPSTVRDAVALPINYELFTIYPHIKSWKPRYGLLGLDFVRMRTNLLPADKLMQQAFDPYVFVRNAYLQRRATLIKRKYPNDEDEDTYVTESQ